MNCYEIFFAFFWFVWVLALLAVPAILVALLPVGLAQSEDEWLAWLILPLAALACIVYVVFLINHVSRLRVRSGALPCMLCAHAPSSQQEIVDFVRKIKTRGEKFPHVVSGGWGHFLKRQGASPGLRLYMSNYVGTVEGEKLVPLNKTNVNSKNASELRWAAGTSIAKVNVQLAKAGLTVPSHPTMDYIGVGTWFAMGNHGNNTELPNENVLLSATVMDCETERINDFTYKQLRKAVDDHIEERIAVDGDLRPARYIVLDVRLFVVPNEPMQQQGWKIDSAESLQTYASNNAALRLCFIGAARDHALAVSWSTMEVGTKIEDFPLPNCLLQLCGQMYDKNKPHRDPHDCQQLSRFTQVDTCSVTCGWYENGSKKPGDPRLNHPWNGVSTRRNANKWVPWLSGFELLVVVFGGFINFEVVFKRSFDSSLWGLMEDMIKFHRREGGRAEVRNTGSIVYWDVSLRSRANFKEFFRILRVNKVEAFALHPGKNTKFPLRALSKSRSLDSVPLQSAFTTRMPLGEIELGSAPSVAGMFRSQSAMFRV